VARERLLFLDEDMPKRLARELCVRGRKAITIYSTDLKGNEDPDLIPKLVPRFGPDVVFVTADDDMPEQHGKLLAEAGMAVACIDGRYAQHGYSDQEQDAWKREVVHRWAHVMQDQAPGTIRRYSLKQHRVWRSKLRRGRQRRRVPSRR
jgi:hypothetical protein